MTARLRSWSLRIAAAVAGFLLLLAVLVFALVGTEPGSRWALQQAINRVPGTLEVPELHGTFLGTLNIPRLQYANAQMRLVASDLEINIDWSDSSLDRVALQRLYAADVTYESLAAPDPSPKPLEVSMPPLPIQLGFGDILIRSLSVGEMDVANITATDLRIDGNHFTATSSSAEVDQLVVTISRFSAKLEGDVPVSADVEWRSLDGDWSGEGRLGKSLAALSFEHDLAGPYSASASGAAFLLDKTEPEFDATVRFERWQFASVVVSDGEVQVVGTASAYRTEFSANVDNTGSLSAHVSGTASGDRYGLGALEALAIGPAGEIRAMGALAWLPIFTTDLNVVAQNIDPSIFAPTSPGKLNTELHVVATSANNFALDIKSLTGVYNDVPARAAGRVSLTGDAWTCADCDLVIGPNHITVDGSFGDGSVAADYRINAPALKLLWLDLDGALNADGRVRGTTSLPRISGNLEGSELAWNDWKVGSVSLHSRSSSIEKVDFDLRVDGLRRADSPLGSGMVRANGDVGALDSEADWSLGDIQISATALLAIDDVGVSGEVRSASLTERFSGAWNLSGPVQVAANAEELRVTEHEWLNGGASLHVTRFDRLNGMFDAEATLQGTPLRMFNTVMPENIRVEGVADAELLLRQQDVGWLGHIRWQQRNTIVHVEQPGEEKVEILVPVMDADVRLTGVGAEGNAAIAVDPGVKGSLEFAVDGFSTDSMMTARLQFDGNQWDWIPAIVPEIDNFSGTISTDISARGSVGAPQLDGELLWQGGRIDVPALNVPLKNIELNVTGSSAGSAIIAGEAKAGKGTVAVAGRFDDLMLPSRSFTAELTGKRATVLDWTDYQMAASPDLVVAGGPDGISVTGSIGVNRAEITVKELPEGAVSPSADVIVTGREAPPDVQIPVRADVQLMLGEKAHIRAFGLDTNLEGQLRFRVPESGAPRANGELKLVDGEYRAYGQQLKIERGTMTFTGPIDDPTIDIRAVRVIEALSGTITAGIDLRGRAQNISSTVFSSPAMSDADALSYLTIGRPLNEASASEGNALANTAYSLGLRQATAITNQIGRTLGLDQLAVTGSNQSTTALVAGKQVNSRLYVRYAYSAFTQLGNLLLRYKLNNRLTIEAGTGESEMMDLLYIVEKP